MKEPKHMTEWKHDELLDDLAQHLAGYSNAMMWRDMQLGPAGSPRPDIFTMFKSYSRPRPAAYEVKARRSDFLADVTEGKYLKYYKFAATVVFAVPRGLIKLNELPVGCGLIVRSEKGWRHLRKPIVQGVSLKWELMQKLLIDGVHREGPMRRLKGFNQYSAQKKLAAEFGQEVVQVLNDIESAKNRAKQIIFRAEHSASRIKEKYEQAMPITMSTVAGVLGIDLKDMQPNNIRLAITDAVEQLTGQAKEREFKVREQAVRYAAERALDSLKQLQETLNA